MMMSFDKHLQKFGFPWKPIFAIPEVAYLLNRSNQTVRNLLASGRLHGLKVGYRWNGVYADSLEKLIEGGIR